MRIKYTSTIKLEIIHEIDDLNNLKSDREYAEDICKMVADECANVNAVCCYDIVESKMYASCK